ncbi:MAG: DUF475 domain-containing protein [Verrucomicrobia bacterium]|nr:DUF475 domain-containing protein [Verrucomicrobiota bacterium]
MTLSELGTHLPSLADCVDALPVILSLVIIESLLSVDNALAIAAMARHLPESQRKMALQFGIIGAYFFRGACMALASWIIENPWLKIGGSAYLICLMCSHFASRQRGGDSGGRSVISGGFLATVLSIEVMDLSLSVDNVVAAVAMSPKLWVVCTGVFIGILALRFVAGACMKLIERFPVLEQTAFMLIGYVGFILLFEILSDPDGGFQVFPGPVHVGAVQKFVGIVIIIVVSLGYSKSPALQKWFGPVLKVAFPLMQLVSALFGALKKAVLLPFQVVRNIVRAK